MPRGVLRALPEIVKGSTAKCCCLLIGLLSMLPSVHVRPADGNHKVQPAILAITYPVTFALLCFGSPVDLTPCQGDKEVRIFPALEGRAGQHGCRPPECLPGLKR